MTKEELDYAVDTIDTLHEMAADLVITDEQGALFEELTKDKDKVIALLQRLFELEGEKELDNIKLYGGWSAFDVIDMGESLNYNIPLEVAEEIIFEITRNSCEVTWDRIEESITSDTELDVYKVPVKFS